MIKFNEVRQIVADVLRDENERGGPMQRQYPAAVIESMANSVASRVMDLIEVDVPVE